MILRKMLQDLCVDLLTEPCANCHTCHPRYLIDTGGEIAPPQHYLFSLSDDQLNQECQQDGEKLLFPMGEIGTIIDCIHEKCQAQKRHDQDA